MSKVIDKLSLKDIKDYFLKHNPQFSDDSISIDFVDIGNINFVYSISTSKGTFYLKYGLDHERKKTIFTDYFKLRKNRLKKEVDFIKFLRTNLKSFKNVFPFPVHFNEKSNIFIMGDVSKGKKQLKNELEGGVVEIGIVDSLAKFIAQQHSVQPTGLEDDLFFRNLLFFRTVLSANKLSEDYQKRVKREYEEIINEKHRCFINGDFSPKNIFYKKEKFGICDLEFCCFGDPLYDVGFFLAHYYLLKLFKPDLAKKIDKAISSFLKYYAINSTLPIDMKRINFYIGTGILNRIDAVPRENYMITSKVDEVRKYALKLIR